MVDRIYFPNPPAATTGPPAKKAEQASAPKGNSPFAGLLDKKLPPQEVRFSQHAQERLKARGISLGEPEMRKLNDAVDTLAGKGGKESLVMLGDAALVVSVSNRTVITAMEKENMRGNVFTNIDSAVVL